jgi:DNA-binding NarL/FixJ family response regulator
VFPARGMPFDAGPTGAYRPRLQRLMRAHPTIRILCVDDHVLVREGIRLVLEQQPDMKVVGSVGTAEESITLFEQIRPDITLMDLRLGSMSGVDAIRSIRRIDPSARTIVLTVHQGDEDIYQAMAAGAFTYVLKDTLSDDLIRTIREVHAGKRPIQPHVQTRLEERASTPPLTPREIQVLELISQGLRNREIAIVLGIHEETVQVHVCHILDKLDVNDRTAATTVALRRGIIQLS